MLGCGGFASVYEGTFKIGNNEEIKVAIKELNLYLPNGVRNDYFENEIKTSMIIMNDQNVNANIVSIYSIIDSVTRSN